MEFAFQEALVAYQGQAGGRLTPFEARANRDVISTALFYFTRKASTAALDDGPRMVALDLSLPFPNSPRGAQRCLQWQQRRPGRSSVRAAISAVDRCISSQRWPKPNSYVRPPQAVFTLPRAVWARSIQLGCVAMPFPRRGRPKFLLTPPPRRSPRPLHDARSQARGGRTRLDRLPRPLPRRWAPRRDRARGSPIPGRHADERAIASATGRLRRFATAARCRREGQGLPCRAALPAAITGRPFEPHRKPCKVTWSAVDRGGWSRA